MLPIISGRQGDLIKIEVTINLSGSMLEAEESILQGVNAVGTVATGEALKRFDADGDPIMVGGAKWYSKGKVQKIYHTPYGVVSTERHVYQVPPRLRPRPGTCRRQPRRSTRRVTIRENVPLAVHMAGVRTSL